jgi:hypothetical protein
MAKVKYDLVSVSESFGKGKITETKAKDKLMKLGYSLKQVNFYVENWKTPILPVFGKINTK